MTYRADPVAQRLDRMAEATGVPRLSRRFEEGLARPFRILPLLIIAMLCAGLWAQAHYGAWGYSLVLAGWSFTVTLQLFGPLRQPKPGEQRDERERMLVMMGHLRGLIVTMIVVIVGCALFAFRPLFPAVWMPDGPMDWLSIAFFLMGLEANVALAVASWTLPRGDAWDEDEG
jgi:hypothetical protein